MAFFVSAFFPFGSTADRAARGFPSPFRVIVLGLIAATCSFAAPAAPTSWTKHSAPHFDLLSAATPEASLEWALEFEAFFSEVAATLPTASRGRPPLTVVLFPSDTDLGPWKPQIDGKPHSSAAFAYRTRSAAVVLMSVKDPDNVQRRMIYHDALHWMTGALANRQPLWFQEGLAELFSSFQLQGRQRSLGLPVSMHTALLQRETLMPLAKLLAVDRESWLYDEANRSNVFYAQAWAFAHFLFLNRDQSLRTAAAQFATKAQTAELSEAAFQEAFQCSYADMEKRLAAFLQARRFGVSRVTIDRAALLARISKGAASPGEVERALGRVMLAQQRLPEAERLIDAALRFRADEWATPLLAGEFALARKDYPAAHLFLNRSIELGCDLDAAFYWRGYARLQFATGQAGGKEIDGPAARAISDDFIESLRRNPRHLPTVLALSSTLVPAVPRKPDDRVILEQAVNLWPRDATLLMNLAALDARENRIAQAQESWRRIVALDPPPSPQLKKRAEGHLAQLEAASIEAELQQLLDRRDLTGLRARITSVIQTHPAQRSTLEQYLKRLAHHEALDRASALIGHDDAEAEQLLRAILRSSDADLGARTGARLKLDELRKRTPAEP